MTGSGGEVVGTADCEEGYADEVDVDGCGDDCELGLWCEEVSLVWLVV